MYSENNIFKISGKDKVRIAIFDSGFAYKSQETQSFAAKVFKRMSFLEGDANGNVDNTMHGTHVIYQVYRVAPNARLYSCRVADRGDADEAAVVRALEWAVGKNDQGIPPERQVDVINKSFEWEHEEAKVEQALQAAQNAGILLFAAVSNFGALGVNSVLYPARSKFVIAVDAADGWGISCHSTLLPWIIRATRPTDLRLPAAES
jgi:subtilisin family serine protease